MSKKRNKSIFVCSGCGGEHSIWAGKCGYCGAWDTLKELAETTTVGSSDVLPAKPVKITEVKNSANQRIKTDIEELDLVLGGGLVLGSVILLGGHPGIGKSTLVLQLAGRIKGAVYYIAGEESAQQIKMRCERLGQIPQNLEVIENQDINSWLNLLKKNQPKLLVVDSIQTVYDSSISTSAGSIVQVKQSALKIIREAKRCDIPTVIIGHVTKEGEVAGPKTLEHLVDGVFYLESTESSNERFLRSAKNRFGPTDEMGVFCLTEKGLIGASDFGRLNPEKKLPIGVVRSAAMEGSRVYFIEIQSLVNKTNFGFPKRNSVGYDFNRLQMLIALLSRHSKIDLNNHDVYLNLSEGYKLQDPLGDLAVLVSLASSFYNLSVAGDLLPIGEVDLAGRVHLAQSAKKIIKTAKKVGFKVPVISKDISLTSLLGQIFRV